MEIERRRERIFKGAYLKLDRLEMELPDGRKGVREVVCVPDAVAVLPVDADGTAHLIRQHRPAIGRTLIEVPAGVLNRPDEPLEACARRECREETGIMPGKLVRLITYAHAEGYSTGFITLFLGLKLRHTNKTRLDPSEYVEQVALPFRKLWNMVRENGIVDSKTILCTILSRPFLKKTVS
jgi:ADP-ribose pyrophosphatase